MFCPGTGHRAPTRPPSLSRWRDRKAWVMQHLQEVLMVHPFLAALTNFILVRLQGGGSGLQIVVLTVQFGNLPVLTLDVLGILLVLGISIVAGVLVGFFTGGPSRSALLGTFFWALL